MRTKLLVLALTAVALPTFVCAYNPPVGIPNPSTTFGWEIDRPTPAWPTNWTASTPSDAANCYYIDKTATGATDTSNPNGNPSRPRKTIPQGSFAAGAFVYVNAGTYGPSDRSGTRYNWYGAGTSTNPIWISGNPTTRPIINDLVHIGDGGNTSYLIFENFEISGGTGAALRLAPTTDGQNIDHVICRNIVRTGTQVAADSNGITISISQGTDTLPSSTVTDIVIYNSQISYTGDPSPTGSDDHGIEGGFHTNRIWVLDNIIHDVGGDSIQASHYANYTDRVASNYYIGRNTFYHNGENGVDFKNIQGFIISQNNIYGPFQREQGAAIVLHYGASTSFHCRNGVILFNAIHHVSSAVAMGLSSGADNVDLIGNTFWDVKASYAVLADSLNGCCLQLGGTTDGANSVFRVVDNTFYDYDRGLLLSPKPGDLIEVHGNIFANRSDSTKFEVSVPHGLENTMAMDYNFYTGTPAFFWDGSSRSLSYVQGSASQEGHSIVGTPAFTDAANGNFHLTDTSPAIDVSVEGPVGDSAYVAFFNKYGLDIKKDYDGHTRPVDTLWDMGAFESALAPRAPSNLMVHP